MELKHVNDGNVVSLHHRGGAMIFPAIAQVDAYWEALRAGRLMPDRDEIDPRGLEDALSQAFILEHVAPGVGRIRVAGMHLSDLLGMEVRGMPLTSFFMPDERDKLSKLLESVVGVPQVADISLSGPRAIGRPPLRARLLLAPLSTTGGGAPRVLGALQATGKIGRPPRRFKIDQVQIRRIVAIADTTRPYPDAAAGQLAQPGFAEPAKAFGARKDDRAGKARPSLRLVRNDD